MLTIRNHKFIALLLCFVMVATSVAQFLAPATVNAAENTALTIWEIDPDTEEGEPIDSTFITEGGHTTLKVEGATGDVQWQFYAEEADTWVSIYGETEETILLKYAKVANMLNDKDKTQIRCIQKDGDNVIESNAVDFKVEPSEDAWTFPATGRVITDYSDAKVLKQATVIESDDAGIMTAAETPNLEKCTVTINYLFKLDNSVAADPYVANVSKGSQLKINVKSPTIVGYETQDTVVELNYDAVNESEDIYVYYVPKLVDYKVEYYLQNVDAADNDEVEAAYTLAATEATQGLTGTELNTDVLADAGLKKQYDGFYQIPFEPVKVAADGSTVVKVYYDRLYYLMKFNLNGGVGVEPIYARFGAPVEVANPTRMGYEFAGWTPNVPSTVPVNGGTYDAQWDAQDTTYTVVYWAENANDNNYSYWGYKTVNATSGSTVSGSDNFEGDKTGFHYDHADTDKIVKGDGSTVVNVYYKRNTYTLTFAYDGGPLICNLHVHSNDCYKLVCTETEHTHTYEGTYRKGGFIGIGSTTYYVGGCYPDGSVSDRTGGGTTPTCGLNEHTHRNSCYGNQLICGKEGVTNHNHSVANGCYGIKFENVKYGQATDAFWAQAPNKKWLVSANGTTFYTNAPAMPNSNLTIYGTTQSGSSVIHYYEKVNGQETTNKVRDDYTVNTDGWSFTSEDYIEIPGFTFSSSRNNNSGTQYYIYYVRNSYTLTFKNGSETKDGGTHLYQADISEKNWTNPKYTGDEAAAYDFGGWYTTEQCIEGTEFNFTNAKMPYNNLILYAKWIPKTHKVTAYLDDSKAVKLGDVQEIIHNGYAVEPDLSGDHEYKGYKFVAWFYMENGVEKAFDFQNMPVTKDLELYAKWSSDVLSQYFIYYRLKDTDIDIANPTTGSSLAGGSKFFEAKGGEDLYDGYQEGYYPTTKNHTMQINVDNNKNVFIFEYVAGPPMPYIVKYVNAETGEELIDAKEVKDNKKAVVTEDFVVIPGYLPDEYQKRLVVSADGVGNEIIFYYRANTTQNYYKITHRIQNISGDGYTVYSEKQQIADKGTVITEEPLELSGFIYNEGKSNATGTVELGDPLELNLYYDRIEYPYQINYLEQGTDKVLKPAKTGEGRYQAQVQEYAPSITGYDLVTSTNPHVFEIQIEDPKDVASLNVKNFYYKEKDATINYQVGVGTGTVTAVESNTTGTAVSETVTMVTGEAKGATPTAGEDYHFAGWYTDADCTSPVTETWVANDKITPVKDEDAHWPESSTYYAKFEENTVTITYVVEGPQNCGTVENDEDGVAREVDETILVLNGEADGATAAARVGYEFVGWFDEEGKMVSEDKSFRPEPVNGKNIEATYSARFVEEQVPITYTVVGPEGCGYVGLGEATDSTAVTVSENVLRVSGEAQGATASPSSNTYKFVGWYTDESCSGEPISTDPKYAPSKIGGSIWNENGLNFYAKFDWNVADLTITKVGIETVDNHDSTENEEPGNAEIQSSVFKITNEELKYNQTVVIAGNGSVTIAGLQVGNYTITELTDWSWRYGVKDAVGLKGTLIEVNEDKSIRVGVEGGKDNSVLITNSRNNEFWLNGGAYAENGFGEVSE